MRPHSSPLVQSLALVLLLSACGKAENGNQSSQAASAFSVEDAGKVTGAINASAALGTPAWGSRRSWTQAVSKVVIARFDDFNKAKDVEVFCPGYRRAAKPAQVHCWVMIAAAISKFESAFKPESSFREPDGNYSIGLLALSPGECPNASTHNSLKQAEANLVCGMNRMATLIKNYGNIDGPADCRGASRYWSTLRAPYKRWDPTRKRNLNLGKRNLILPMTRGYRGGSSGRELMDLELLDQSAEELDVWAWEPRDRDFQF